MVWNVDEMCAIVGDLNPKANGTFIPAGNDTALRCSDAGSIRENADSQEFHLGGDGSSLRHHKSCRQRKGRLA